MNGIEDEARTFEDWVGVDTAEPVVAAGPSGAIVSRSGDGETGDSGPDPGPGRRNGEGRGVPKPKGDGLYDAEAVGVVYKRAELAYIQAVH